MKKLYSLILFMCLAIGSAWADNGFELLGIKPNVANGSTGTWPASSLVTGATGTITYTPSEKTLVFDNVNIPAGHDKKVVYNKSVNGMKILFVGTCDLYSKNKIIQYDTNTTLNGALSTRVRMHSMWDEETIFTNNSSAGIWNKLEITDFMYLELWSLDDYCISFRYGDLKITDSHIVMEGDKGTLHSDNIDGSYGGRVYLSDCFYGGNYDFIRTGGSWDAATQTGESSYEKVKKCEIIRGSAYSGVRLNGLPVLASDSRWKASAKTLTLSANVSASSNFTYPAAITVEKPGITIDGGGNQAYGKRYGITFWADNTTIRNITLNGNSYGTYTNDTYNNITIGDNVVIYGVSYAIYGGRITFNPSAGKSVMLMPVPGLAETTYGTLFRQQAIIANSIKLNDCSIYPEGLTVSGTTIASGGTPYNAMITIKGLEKYDLYINGTQVNEKNKDNLTSLLGSNATGTLKYNPSTKTLTMNNLKAAPSTSVTNGTLISSNYGYQTIAVEGENEITANSKSSYTLFYGGKISITKGSTSTSKLTLKGNPKYSFFRATGTPTIENVTLIINGECSDGGIVNTVANASGNINNATVSIKCGSKPLGGMWATSGVYGNLQRSDGPAITINPSTKELVYFYDNATSPSSDVVTEAINIYPTGTYTMTVSGSKPQSYTSANGVCYDEFSNRLYLRNASVNGKITFSRSDYESNMWSPTIYTIGNCSVTNSDIPFGASVHGLTFTGPGTLNLTNAGTKEAAARFTGCSGDVVVKNTTLKMNAAAGMICTHSDYTSYLRVINSTIEAHGTSGYYMLNGFTSLVTSGCKLYIPQNGYYYNTDNYHGNLRNADGTVASDMLISPNAPATLALDTKDQNGEAVNNSKGQYKTVSIKNLRLNAGGYWRTICLPFDLKLSGSVLKDCEVRELSSMTKRNDKTTVLDFTKRVTSMKHDTPYLIRNIGSTDIVNPNFGAVRMEGDAQYVQDGVAIDGKMVFQGDYDWWTWDYDYLYALEDDPVLVRKSPYTRDAFSCMFLLNPNLSEFYVIYTGTEDNLIDGIGTVHSSESIVHSSWFDLGGRKFDSKPEQPGIYIQNGKKVAIK